MEVSFLHVTLSSLGSPQFVDRELTIHRQQTARALSNSTNMFVHYERNIPDIERVVIPGNPGVRGAGTEVSVSRVCDSRGARRKAARATAQAEVSARPEDWANKLYNADVRARGVDS